MSAFFFTASSHLASGGGSAAASAVDGGGDDGVIASIEMVAHYSTPAFGRMGPRSAGGVFRGRRLHDIQPSLYSFVP